MSLHYNRELLNTGNTLVLKVRISQTQRTIPNNWSQILWMTSFCVLFTLIPDWSMLPVKWHLLASYVCEIKDKICTNLFVYSTSILWLIPVVFQFCLLPKVAVADLIFFPPIFRVTNVTTSGERTPKTPVFIVSNGGIDTISLHSLNFCLLTNKVRHLHWIIVIHWQG